jgi:hypothetical protein
MQRVYDMMMAVNSKAGITPELVAQTLAGTKAGATADYLVARAEQEERRKIAQTIEAKPLADARASAVATAKTTETPRQTVSHILEQFDEWNEQRNLQRHRNEVLRTEGKVIREKKSQTIGNERLASMRRYIDRFKKTSGSETWDGTEKTLTGFLEVWKADAAKAGHATHDEAVKTIRQFVMWAHKRHLLDTLPRNLDEIVTKFNVSDANATAIPQGDIIKLFTAATDDMRAWIACGLNFGFKPVDIANLTNETIGATHLDFVRTKTGVHVQYKIWPVTRTMIERSRTATTGRAWTTRKGMPLVHTSNASRTRGKSNNITKQFRELCHAVGLVREVNDPKQHGKMKNVAKYDFSNVRDTGSTAIEQIDKSITDIYLAHQDARMARLYVDGKMTDSGPLDAALDRLEATFKLPEPAPKANKWKGEPGE